MEGCTWRIFVFILFFNSSIYLILGTLDYIVSALTRMFYEKLLKLAAVADCALGLLLLFFKCNLFQNQRYLCTNETVMIELSNTGPPGLSALVGIAFFLSMGSTVFSVFPSFLSCYWWTFDITSSESGLIKHVAYLIDILTRGTMPRACQGHSDAIATKCVWIYDRVLLSAMLPWHDVPCNCNCKQLQSFYQKHTFDIWLPTSFNTLTKSIRSISLYTTNCFIS